MNVQPPGRARRSEDVRAAVSGFARVWHRLGTGALPNSWNDVVFRQAPEPLEIGQARALEAIVSHGPCRMGELAEVLQVEASTATRVVDRLVNQELAERAPHAADRRGVLVRATRAGIARTEMLTQRSDAALGGVLEAFTVEEIDLLTDYLGQLAEAMDEWLTSGADLIPTGDA